MISIRKKFSSGKYLVLETCIDPVTGACATLKVMLRWGSDFCWAAACDRVVLQTSCALANTDYVDLLCNAFRVCP